MGQHRSQRPGPDTEGMSSMQPQGTTDDATRYERVEQVFHDRVWETANAFSSVERAMADARQLAYAVLKYADPEEHDTLRWMAETWLDDFGRDRLREARSGAKREQP